MIDLDPIGIASFRHKNDNQPRPSALTWEDLRAALTDHKPRARKDGPLWSPVFYKPEQLRRANDNVQAVTCFVADVDDGTPPAALSDRWAGLAWCLHSSFSSTPDKPKWRVVLPLAAPVPAEEWPAVHRKLVFALTDGHSDPSCKDVSRMYYTPACPDNDSAREHAFADFADGAPLGPAAFPEPPPPDEAARVLSDAARRSGRAVQGQSAPGSSDNRPGDDYNRRGAGEALALLEGLGLRVKRDRGDTAYLGWADAPGGEWCASFGFVGPGVFYPWTPNLPGFEALKCYSPFAVYAQIKCGGDFKESAKQLGEAGYGEPKRKRGEPPSPSPVALRAQEKASDHDADSIPTPTLKDERGRPDFAPSQIVKIAGRGSWGVAGLDTHAAHARRIAEHLGDDLCYCPQLGWLLWSGKRWERDDKEATRATAKIARLSAVVRDEAARLFECVGALLRAGRTEDGQALERAAKRHIQHTKAVESTAFIAAALHQAAGLLPVETERFNPKPYIVGFDNGVWDRGEWREHRRGDYMMNLSPVALDTRADASEWLAVLSRITGGDGDFARTLQETMGYALSGAPFLRTLPWLYGPRGTGKSTVAELLMTLLGEMAGSVDPQLLSDVAERERLGVVLWNRRLVVCAEAGAQRISAEVLKTQTGGDRYPVRQLYREGFTAAPSHVLLMVANDAPNMSAYDDALRERVMALPCEHPLNKPEPLKLTGGARIEAVRTDATSPLVRGFAAWAVDGMRQVMAGQTIHRAECVIAATAEFWADTDPLTAFWEGVSVGELENGIPVAKLRSMYQAWCVENSMGKPLGHKAWPAACRARGLYDDRKAVDGGVIRTWKLPANPEIPDLMNRMNRMEGETGKPLRKEKNLHSKFSENTPHSVHSVHNKPNDEEGEDVY